VSEVTLNDLGPTRAELGSNLRSRKLGLASREGVTAAALMAMTFEPVRYVIPGYIAEGVTLLAGPPKIGKSWLVLGLAVAVAGFQPAFGSIACDGGDVLYLALEDNRRRLKKRLLQMGHQSAPDRLTFVTEWPTLDSNCIGELETWVESVKKPTLIIVDVLARVRRAFNGRDQLYDADYRTLIGLQQLARNYHLAILVIHHTRKMPSDDPFDCVSGTHGLTGAADTVLVLKRDIGTAGSGRVSIYGRGRDIEEIETVAEFNGLDGTWRIIGGTYEVARSSERQAIFNILRSTARPLNARETSDLIDKQYGATRKMLTRMAMAGEIDKVGRGLYTCPNSPIVPNSPNEAR